MKTKKLKASILSVALVSSLILTSVSGVIASGIVNEAKQGILENTPEGEKIHESIDISTIRNEGGNPPELLSTASALASAEKEWYEYIRYSSEPIGICNVSDTSRIVFHDPYDYGNSLIMEIDDSITDWSSSNSLTATYETGNTITTDCTKSTETVSSVEVAKGPDTSSDVSVTTVEGQIDTYNKSKTTGTITDETDQEDSTSTTKYNSWDIATEYGEEAVLSSNTGFGIKDVLWEEVLLQSTTYNGRHTDTEHTGEDVTTDKHGKIKTNTTYSDDYAVTDEGWTKDNTTTTTKTNVTTVVADRMSSALGQNISETKSWSTSDSHSISKTYNASYFNSSGSPLQWKIVKYKVIMPLLYQTQILVDGEWINTLSGYCTLTTIQGTCRAWMENNQAFYEHWGTGEPVTWSEFWGTFFTKEKLVEAYQNKLYPDQVRSVKSE